MSDEATPKEKIQKRLEELRANLDEENKKLQEAQQKFDQIKNNCISMSGAIIELQNIKDSFEENVDIQ